MRSAALAALLLLGACAGAQPPCPPFMRAALLTESFFGRNIGERLGVDEAAWQRFVDAELTPRFPEGLSVADAAGQWRGRDGRIVREPAKRLSLVLTQPAAQRPLLAAAIAAYKRQFDQEAVLMAETSACVAF